MTVFNPVNLELGTIPSRTNEIFKNRILNLSNHGQELNVNKIHRTNYFLLPPPPLHNQSHQDNKFISILLKYIYISERYRAA